MVSIHDTLGSQEGYAVAGGEPDTPVNQGLHVTCISRDGRIRHCWLPKIPEGQFEFPGLSKKVFIEARKGQWVARCTRPSTFMKSPTEHMRSVALGQNQLLALRDEGKEYLLFVEAAEQEGAAFHNYRMPDSSAVRIGSSLSNDITYASKYVSREHAVISRRGNAWEILDTDSANGVYVNDARVQRAPLKLGDTIFIMGLMIVVGKGFLSINDSRKGVQVHSSKLTLVQDTAQLETARASGTAVEEKEPFNRKPRHRVALAARDVEIEGPPMSMSSNQIPLVLRFGGSAVMGGASVLTGNLLPLLSTLLFPILTSKYSEQQIKEYEQRRQVRYAAYLKDKEAEIRAEAERERDILCKNYPPISTILRYPFGGEHLWERRNVDDDFLHVRLGTGCLPLRAQVKYPERRFQLDSDALEERMFDLGQKPVYLDGAPLVVSLVDNYVSSIKGENEVAFNFIQRIMAQIAILQSYDEVKIVILANEHQLQQMEYVRALPHCWDNQRSIRFIATDSADAYQISTYLRSQLGEDLNRPPALKEILKKRPYYCVFALDKQVFDSMELLKDAMALESNCGISVITAFSDPPKDCMLVMDLSTRGQHKAVYLKDIELDDDSFQVDSLSGSDVASSLARVANTTIRQVNRESELPLSCTFLEMFGVGSIEQLAPLRRWRESDPTRSLAVPVGVSPDGEPFMLDLHEKHHGPHGLVAGMTGSGKSEFLLTYILSMAIHFHPDEVAFVLIDYKGGGLAGAFLDEEKGIHLPHVVGTITNLDGASIQRSLISLEAEVKRRQHVFNKAKSIANEGTMDIYGYQKLYRKGVVKDPVPHLIIVSDEFAELKQQQPEFMDQLVSIARIGRSLGVHLILATQKPAGVVNDQIRSNAKFKVCLKVQTREDSMDMLKRPEAAELKEIGRFYLQVGYNESFSVGQSGWSGAQYEKSDEVVKQEDNSVQFIDYVGQDVHVAKPVPYTVGSGKSQLVSIVEELMHTTTSMGLEPQMLWKDELPKVIDIDGFEKIDGDDPDHVSAAIGIVDDPEKQRQFPLVLDLQSMNNALIAGESGFGKTTLAQSLLLALARRYSPERVNFYILDYSGGMLEPFSRLPHCGAVLNEEQFNELDGFFKLLNEIIAERKRLFRELGVGSFEAACEIQPIPLVLVIIDNVSLLSSTKAGENHAYRLHEYLKSGLGYGIRYCITCGHANELVSRARQEIGTRMSLMQVDKFAYADVLNCRCDYVPASTPGRGLYNYEGIPLEFQVASFSPKASRKDIISLLKAEVDRLSTHYGESSLVRKMVVVEENQTYAEFSSQFKPERIPIGYTLEEARPIALPLRQFSALSLFFGSPSGKPPIIENFINAAQAENMHVIVVKAMQNSLFDEGGESPFADMPIETVNCNIEKIYDFLRNQMLSIITRQRNVLKEYCAERGIEASATSTTSEAFAYVRENTEPTLVVFENFSDVFTAISKPSDRVNADVITVLAKGFFEYSYNLNVYYIGCFGPNDQSALYSSELFKSFNPDSTCLLFGGRVDEQKIASIPWGLNEFNKEGVFNRCIMTYRGECHALVMPSRQPDPEAEDPDEKSIFE